MKNWFVWVVSLGLLTGCQYLTLLRKQTLTLDAPKDVELVVYNKVGRQGQKVMNPVGLIRGGESIDLVAGEYLLANECSGYEFKHSSERPTKIPVRRLMLTLHGENTQSPQPDAVPVGAESAPVGAESVPVGAESVPVGAEPAQPAGVSNEENDGQIPVASSPSSPTGVVHTLCVDPLDRQRNEWTNRRQFDILPGTTEMRIGGRVMTLENHGETSEPILLDLYPIMINSQFPDIQARFYLTPEEKDAKQEVSAVSLSANNPMWLLIGNYSLEVNGTRRKVTVEQGARTEISVGVLRIDMPAYFPIEDRLKAGGQPVFVYLDTGALMNLDTDYLVFPGSYTVSLEGSEVQDTVQVEGGERTLIKTFAARVDVPPCPESLKNCKSPPRITIHRDQKPYALMMVEPRLPFLLLEGTYEYGVEGLRGIKRTLQRRAESLAGEPLARVRLKWDVRQAQGRYRTDLVRIESRGQSTFGRSLDLLFHKPDEVYVPAGNYDLTYFVGDPQLERSKSRQSLFLEPGQTREVVIPIYVEKVNRSDDGGQGSGSVKTSSLQDSSTSKAGQSAKDTAEGDNTPAALPRSLTPLRR
ncbi:MAG: hypothetical protein RL189_1243 [Pseudomonadota bacterium]|jgi:hypothetical protein